MLFFTANKRVKNSMLRFNYIIISLLIVLTPISSKASVTEKIKKIDKTIKNQKNVYTQKIT